MVTAFIVIYAGGQGQEIVTDIRKLPFIKEAKSVQFSVEPTEVEMAIMAKLVAPKMTEKQLMRFVKDNIRNIGVVTSTMTLKVVEPEEKLQPIDESLIVREKENWGPWR